MIHSIIDPMEIMERKEDPGVWQEVPGGLIQGQQYFFQIDLRGHNHHNNPSRYAVC